MNSLQKLVSVSVNGGCRVLCCLSASNPLTCLKEVFGLLEAVFVCAGAVLLVLTVVFVAFGTLRDAFSARGHRG